MLREILVTLLIATGAVFMLLAGVGILRMPDLFLRISATSKAGTLGAGLILLGAAFYFDELSIYTRALATICFLILTAPVAAHMIGRAAYFDGVPLWKGTILDDLAGHYKRSDHSLSTQPLPPLEQVTAENEADDFREEN